MADSFSRFKKNNFSMRLGIVGGRIQAEQLQKVYEIASKYGQGYIHMTSRQSIEIPFIKLEDIETVKQELAEAELYPASSWPRIRTITACQGNSFSLLYSQKMNCSKLSIQLLDFFKCTAKRVSVSDILLRGRLGVI